MQLSDYFINTKTKVECCLVLLLYYLTTHLTIWINLIRHWVANFYLQWLLHPQIFMLCEIWNWGFKFVLVKPLYIYKCWNLQFRCSSFKNCEISQRVSWNFLFFSYMFWFMQKCPKKLILSTETFFSEDIL